MVDGRVVTRVLHVFLLLLLHWKPVLLVLDTLQPVAVPQALVGGATGNGGGGALCWRRYETSPAQVDANAAHLLVPSAPLGVSFSQHGFAFRHAIVDHACPRYVMALQNENAGAGHRLREFVMGVWASSLFNLTMVYWPMTGDLNERPGLKQEHGVYRGWDDLLGLGLGENRSLTYWEVSARKDVIRELNVGGFKLKHFTVPNAEGEMKYAHLGDPSACAMLYLIPGNNWIYDPSHPVRPAMQYKFLHAVQRPEYARSLFSTTTVNIAVHYRRGDMVPTSEFALWRIVASEVMPALQLAGVRALPVVHVFADSGANASSFTIFNQHFSMGSNLFFHFLEDPVLTLYNLAHSDIFVGSRSSFSWMAALVSSQPYCLMQTMDPQHEFCPSGSGCCTMEGECVSVCPTGATLPACATS